jgi:hypothetical protein
LAPVFSLFWAYGMANHLKNISTPLHGMAYARRLKLEVISNFKFERMSWGIYVT